MADLLFKAFVSCSFAEEDKGLRSFFEELIGAFDIQPFTYDYQEMGDLESRIKEHIGAADCLVAILTDGPQPADWIRDEITLANAYRKPIAIFLEEGVPLGGLLAGRRRQTFSRANLEKDAAKLARFLFNLRKYLESVHCHDQLGLPVLMRQYLRVKERVISPSETELRCGVLMECLAEELEASHHQMELEDQTPGLSLSPRKFEFLCTDKPKGVEVTYSVIRDTASKFLWKVLFEPPLRRGQRVEYAFKVVAANCRPFTYEDLARRIENGTYESNRHVCRACDLSVCYPADELKYQIEFPEGYEVSECQIDVKLGSARTKADEELRRIRDGDFFTVEKFVDTWCLQLDVPKPLRNHTYRVHYVPPSEAELPERFRLQCEPGTRVEEHATA